MTDRALIAALLALGLASAGPAPGAAPAWEAPRTPVIGTFPGTAGISAASCGGCHEAIWREWQASTHAHAWVDLQFQAELQKDPAIAWLCVNCHLPVANQQPELTRSTGDLRQPGRRLNPTFDAALRDEGVTCLGCHWRLQGIATPHADARAPHPLVHDPDLATPAACTACHQAVARLEDALVCSFDTGEERLAAGVAETCQDCHMPRVRRPVAAGGAERETRRHHWPGSLIPKDLQSPEEAALYSDWQPGVSASLAPTEAVAPGATLTVVARYGNARAGHMLPTGDPERYLLVRLVLADASGTVVAREEHRVGQRWEWWPKARRLDDNRLAPGETREIQVSTVMPRGPVTASLTVEYFRISPENAAYHKIEGYPTHRLVSEESTTLQPL